MTASTRTVIQSLSQGRAASRRATMRYATTAFVSSDDVFQLLCWSGATTQYTSRNGRQGNTRARVLHAHERVGQHTPALNNKNTNKRTHHTSEAHSQATHLIVQHTSSSSTSRHHKTIHASIRTPRQQPPTKPPNENALHKKHEKNIIDVTGHLFSIGRAASLVIPAEVVPADGYLNVHV